MSWRVSWMIAGLVAQAAGREESPDTPLREQRKPWAARPRVKGNAPGNARGTVAQT